METGNWYKFSDETVVPLHGKNAKLEESVTVMNGNKKQVIKVPKVPKAGAVQNSNNAYMLVYMEKQTLLELRSSEIKERTKKESVKLAAVSGASDKKQILGNAEYCFSNGKVFPIIFPQHLRIKIDKDNMEFEEERFERMSSRLQVGLLI